MLQFSLPHDSPVDVSEVGIEVPPYADVGKWRVGKPSDKLGVTIFMRIATRHDTSIGGSLEHGTGAASSESSHLSLEELRQKNIKLRKLFLLKLYRYSGYEKGNYCS